MTYLTRAALTAGFLFAAPALAQTAAPAPQAEAATPAPITDAEVTMFAKAALASDAVSKDATIPAAEKAARMTAAVTATGLETARFNEIAKLAQTDAAVREKVQAEIIAVRDGQQATAPAPTPTASPAPMPSASPTPGQQ
ncbi:DUF4168 domain-containing protein [Sphingomonas sp.]|uniref:DUF4168 domain-containing protein n=1 Tax=Sphingomonas sp. TaxID=28214 RepID=UPI00185F2AC5|nr:DUF4168 domain-containing protein [Sphingomonas sp.]MBA4760454.1 DUF4168 domain-containing protein [Sphingomonas sp.]